MSEKHKVNVSLEVEADSVECARTKVYQALTDFRNVQFCDLVTSYPEPQRKSKRREFWESQDWFGKSIDEIGKLTNTPHGSVLQWRRKLIGVYDPRFPRRNGATKVEHGRYVNADWTKQDIELAREFNVSRERVRQIRNWLGKPKAINHRTRTAAHPPKYKEIGALLKQREGEFGGFTILQMANTFGVSVALMGDAVKNSGIKHRNPKWKYDWDKVNWKLPNIALEKAWGISAHQFANYRKDHRMGKCKWTGRLAYRPPEYDEALAKEIEKAKLPIAFPENDLIPKPA